MSKVAKLFYLSQNMVVDVEGLRAGGKRSSFDPVAMLSFHPGSTGSSVVVSIVELGERDLFTTTDAMWIRRSVLFQDVDRILPMPTGKMLTCSISRSKPSCGAGHRTLNVCTLGDAHGISVVLVVRLSNINSIELGRRFHSVLDAAVVNKGRSCQLLPTFRASHSTTQGLSIRKALASGTSVRSFFGKGAADRARLTDHRLCFCGISAKSRPTKEGDEHLKGAL
jgi:hypothetical protein